MAGRLSGSRVVVLLAEGFEDLEFWVTVMRLQEEGAKVTVAGLTTQPVQGKNGLEATADVEVACVTKPHPAAIARPHRMAQSDGMSRSDTPQIQMPIAPITSVRRPKRATARPSPSTATAPTR